MRIHMKVDDFNINGSRHIEALLGMEEFFEMLDGVKPRVLADYMAHRLRSVEEQEVLNEFNSVQGARHLKRKGGAR